VKLLEMEREKLIKMYDERERSLYDQLNKFDKDEAERRKNRKPQQI